MGPPGGTVGFLEGASCLYEGHIYFERNMILRHHISSPAKVRKDSLANFMSNMFI
jgi:hypothetical protein